MQGDDGRPGAAKRWDGCQLVVVQSPEGETPEEDLITREQSSS